jgi:hypothetical protein
MNPHYEKQLEAGVRRELDTLGELSAPPALANRILHTIAERSATPNYRRAWPSWPLTLRLTSLTVLLGVFGGLCFVTWQLLRLAHSSGATSARLADAQALGRTLVVLGGVASNLFHQLGLSVFITGLAIIFVAGVICIGLGSACVRLALRPASNRILS